MTQPTETPTHDPLPAGRRPQVVSSREWNDARTQLLVKEKAQLRARDALAAERRRMPWMAVERNYVFESAKGKSSLLDLFEGRSQLIVYRAFFEPGVFGWPDHACRGCSMVADQVAHVAHLNARDTTLVFASRAPQADISRLKQRMGWTMPWVTVTDSFDADFGVDEWHGTNVFFRDGDRIFRTYFIKSRGDEQMGGTWNYLDITPLGRQEVWEDSPKGYPQTPTYKWWNWHDSYEAGATPDKKWVEVTDAGEKAFRKEAGEGRDYPHQRNGQPQPRRRRGCPPRCQMAGAGGDADLRDHGRADGRDRRWLGGHALCRRAGLVAGRGGGDVSLDERISFGGVAEADLGAAEGGRPLRRPPHHRGCTASLSSKNKVIRTSS